MSLGPPTPIAESQQILPYRAKNGVCVLNKVKDGPTRAEICEKGVFGPKMPSLLAEFWVPRNWLAKQH